MTAPPAVPPCRNCGNVPAESALDAFGWCERCRAVVIRRATWIARGVAVLLAGGFAVWVFAVVDPGPRFLIVWLVLIGALYFVAFKLTQRVAFEAIRSRGVPPPGS